MGNQTTRKRNHGNDSRERAVTAFLYLGEQLKLQTQAEPFPQDGIDTLFRAIQGEIIPRLMLAHAPDSERPEPTAGLEPQVTAEDQDRLLEAILSPSPADSRRLIEDLLDRGVPREAIFLDLLAFAARRLGEFWETDQVDFATVTIGLCRLHEVLREQSLSPDDHYANLAPDAPSILLATAAADQHVFGVVMVSEFFRKAGWRVSSEPGASADQLAALLAERSFDLLGVSAACDKLVPQMRSELVALRNASRNRDLRVLVGGRLFMETPRLVLEVGADGAAFDAQTAPDAAKSLLAGSVPQA